MIKTYGLTHVALAVKNAKRSFKFYEQVFGVKKVYDQGTFIQAQTPRTRDVLVFDENAERIGKRGGIEHFGFRLQRPKDIDLAAKSVKKAGGKILDKGDFCPGEPYLFCSDPDGYVVEILVRTANQDRSKAQEVRCRSWSARSFYVSRKKT